MDKFPQVRYIPSARPLTYTSRRFKEWGIRHRRNKSEKNWVAHIGYAGANEDVRYTEGERLAKSKSVEPPRYDVLTWQRDLHPSTCPIPGMRSQREGPVSKRSGILLHY